MRFGKKKIAKRLWALLLALVLAVPGVTVPARAAASEPSRAIAIIFDNSGSMYIGENAAAWCRATYAIEVFASMMNDGDTLYVYPMYEVEVNGQRYSDTNPVTLTNATSSRIRTMFTPKAQDTPIEVIDHAYEGLCRAPGDEKWLIVLTDGEEFYENLEPLGRGEPTRQALTERLTSYNRDVNVMYLGMGAVATEPEINGSMQHYVTAARDTANVLGELTRMCNIIFGRDILPVSGSSFSTDIPLSKLIVFVQGENIANVKVIDGSGKEGGQVVSAMSPKYGEGGAGNYSRAKVDKSLQGSIVTYRDVEAGDYTLSYDGSMSSVSVYYEPDVDMAVTLRNPQGEIIQPGSAYEGTYTVEYHMVDKYGNPTDSPLLGTTDYTFNCVISGQEYSYHSTSAGQFPLEGELKAGDTLEVSADVRYLSGYYIHKSHEDLLPGFSLPITIIADSRTLEMDLVARQDYFQLRKLESGDPLVARLTMDGQPLSAENLRLCDFSLSVRDESGREVDPSHYEVELHEEESAWYIKLKNPDGLQLGRYSVTAGAAALNHSNQEISARDTEEFEVAAYPAWLLPLLVVLAILLLLLLIWLFMNAKVLPKNASFVNTRFSVNGNPVNGIASVRFSGGGKKKGSVVITSPKVAGSNTAKCSVVMTVEANSPRRTKSGRRSMRVTKVEPSPGNGNIQSVSIGAAQFRWSPVDKKYVKVGAKPGAPVSFSVGNMARYSITGQTINGTPISLSGQLKHM
ncbi:hypothetical protein [Dysosmobacter sp.]|uniref:hypothetical protein n=1 Tax=Dysosmobacter sp. TaxID=2591382 RepID=UPI002A8CD766|nr:hypothetical protein [Dysosmobacter sp.]MDY3281635.1 hypothetical protein [Dysosmobacter sp.]